MRLGNTGAWSACVVSNCFFYLRACFLLDSPGINGTEMYRSRLKVLS